MPEKKNYKDFIYVNEYLMNFEENEKTGERPMRRLVATCLLLILLMMSITLVHASVEMQATIEENIHVVLIFENVNSTIYNEIRQNEQIFNITTIPRTIIKNLEEQDLTRATWGYDPEKGIIYNDATRSIRVEFFLAGSDIIGFTFNEATMNRIYQVQTEWRKFQIDLTQSFTLDFAQYFGTPVSDWTYNDSERTYHYEYTKVDTFDPSCEFVLPSRALNVQATEDTITFEIPSPPEDLLLNSPFLILVALIIGIMFALLYRRVRK